MLKITSIFALYALASVFIGSSLKGQEKSPCLPGELYDKFEPPGQMIEEIYPIPNSPWPIKITSGGKAFVSEDGRLFTIQGSLDETDLWHRLYSGNRDTLGGRRPQNIFRAVIDRCLLSSQDGFSIELKAVANDFEPPEPMPYTGGFDLVAQWWSPANPNPAFLCREQYGGFCGNVGYHTKIQTNGGLEVARERPAGDNDTANRYTTLARNGNAMPLIEGAFPLNQGMRLRMEVRQTSPQTVEIVSCLDREDDGVFDVVVKARDEARAITGYFVPIIRSDWLSAEFSRPLIGPLSFLQTSCAE